MERYVVSTELAKKLKDAGFLQNTIHWWERPYGANEEKYYLIRPDLIRQYGLWSTQEVKEEIAAPMADELLEQLPLTIRKTYGTDMPVKIDRTKSSKFAYKVRYTAPSYGEYGTVIDSRMTDALAQLWLWCKENGYLGNEESESYERTR